MSENLELFIRAFWPMFKAGLLYSIPMMLISFGLGLIVALALLVGMIYMLFKPYQEATRLTSKSAGKI